MEKRQGEACFHFDNNWLAVIRRVKGQGNKVRRAYFAFNFIAFCLKKGFEREVKIRLFNLSRFARGRC